jgi:hypothetical protein
LDILRLHCGHSEQSYGNHSHEPSGFHETPPPRQKHRTHRYRTVSTRNPTDRERPSRSETRSNIDPNLLRFSVSMSKKSRT